jgi:hypothetical protein
VGGRAGRGGGRVYLPVPSGRWPSSPAHKQLCLLEKREERPTWREGGKKGGKDERRRGIGPERVRSHTLVDTPGLGRREGGREGGDGWRDEEASLPACW